MNISYSKHLYTLRNFLSRRASQNLVAAAGPQRNFAVNASQQQQRNIFKNLNNNTFVAEKSQSLSSCLRQFSSAPVDTGSPEHIKKLVDNAPVVLFMKGVPEQPMCGFSNAVVQIMRMHGVTYDSHNVLDDDLLRAGIKEFSDWPTIPQVYFDGEFVGGCDILLQMHQSGDLVDELKSIGIKSALLEEKDT